MLDTRMTAAAAVAALLTALPVWAEADKKAAPAPAAPASDKPKDGDKPADEKIPEIEEAGELLRAGKADKALDRLGDARKARPELPPVKVMLARMLISGGNAPAGRQFLEQAAVDDPDHPEVFLTFGQLALAEGRVTDALVMLERAKTAPFPPAMPNKKRDEVAALIRSGTASAYEARRDWKSAAAQLAEVLKLETRPKESAGVRQRLGRAMFFQGRPDEAFAELTRAAAADSGLEPPAVSMGRLHTLRAAETEARKTQTLPLPTTGPAVDPAEDLKKAEEWMRRAVKDSPKAVRAHLGLAGWLLDQGRVDEASKAVAEAAVLEPSSVDVRRLQGLIARRARDLPAAEKVFEGLYRESPSDLFHALQLALALAEQDDQKKRERALELAQVAVRLRQNDAEVLAVAGWVAYKAGRLDDAERALQAAAADGQVSSDQAYWMAHVLFDRGRLSEVQTLLKQALADNKRFTYRKEAEAWQKRLTTKGSP
jgi:tetratricopeptide (TPR) repeat protein